MDVGTVIEIVLGMPTMLGGGGILVSKLTRIAVAVESLVESQRKIIGQVDDHEKRLSKGGL